MTLTHQTKQFTIADPRTFEGDPFEVAERAALQAGALATLLRESLAPVRLMLRNAELERQIMDGEKCDPQKFEESLHARKFTEVEDNIAAVEKALKALARAGGYNPKARIRGAS